MHTSTAPVWTATTLTEALRLRAEHPEATVLAGGTDLMVFVESGAMTLDGVLNIWGCEGLSGISSTDEGVRIGAMSTWRDVRASALMPDALRECAATVGAAQIQNRGTVGGNIVNGSPAGDSLPLWLALDAQFEVASVDGSRRIAASEFWTGYRQNAMQPNELLVAVHITPVEGDDLHFRKVGTRMAQAISKVVLGAESDAMESKSPRPAWPWVRWPPHRYGSRPSRRLWLLEKASTLQSMCSGISRPSTTFARPLTTG